MTEKNAIMMDIVKIVHTIKRKKVIVMMPTDEIYYADNEGIICTTANDNIPTTRNTSSDLYDSLLYAAQKINNMEDKNMKRTEKNIEKDQNITITRRCDTSRGIFTVSQLEPTDMFVLIDDEDQVVYMAVYEEEPKYKTKQAVVDMQSGKLLYLDITTKIHVYRAGCELRVGEFIWTSEGYN